MSRVEEAKAAYKKTIESIPPPKARISIEPDASDGDDLIDLLGEKPKGPKRGQDMSEEGKKIAAEAEFDLLRHSMNRWVLCTVKENRIEMGGNSFTITAPNGATLVGKVVAPAGARIWQEEFDFGHEINYWRDHRGANFRRRVLHVGGGEFFFVVMTLQNGAAPEVKISGSGPDAGVTVGGRTVSFDGDLKITDRSFAKKQ